MNRTTIYQELVSSIKNCIPFPDKNIESVELIEDLNLDSLTFVMILVEMEMRCNVMFTDDFYNINNFIKITDLVDSIYLKVNET